MVSRPQHARPLDPHPLRIRLSDVSSSHIVRVWGFRDRVCKKDVEESTCYLGLRETLNV